MGQNGMGSPAFGGVQEINIYTVSQVKVKTCVSKTAFSLGRRGGVLKIKKARKQWYKKKISWGNMALFALYPFIPSIFDVHSHTQVILFL